MARHTLPATPTAAERRACAQATAAERRALWITVLALFATGQISRQERDAYAAALHFELYTRATHSA